MKMDVETNDTPKPTDKKKDTVKDFYTKYKELQKELELLEIQESYIKEETKNLKMQYVRAKEEIKTIKSCPLGIGTFNQMIDEDYALITSSSQHTYCSRVLSTINREDLKPGASIAIHKNSNAVVDVLPQETSASIQLSKVTEKPDVSYKDVGGLDIQKQEIREAVELPLTNPELYQQIGIDPPKGVLLYGPPGTGKTMLAKAVANQTTATFIRVCASEFVQKYLGDGMKMVRDIFRMAKENTPSIVFIDEIDAIATK